MKRTKQVIASLLAATMVLTGCGQSQMVDLNEEQEQQVAEYAAGLMLKYASNYHSRLVDSETELIALADERAHKQEIQAKVDAMKQQEKQEEETAREENSSSSGTSVVDASGGQGSTSVEEITDAISTQITYSGCELVDSYPDSQEDSLVFAMDATEGNKLLVMHFTMTNVTAEPAQVDVASTGCRFRCNVNGDGYQNILTTMLLNDLASYKGTLEAGESQDVVLVMEVPEDTQVQSLELLIKKGSQQVKMPLQ